MARIDNMNNFLTDVADSIRTKTGKTDKIPASSFDTEIASITTSEDLDSELNTYNTELTEQEESLSGIVEYLENKIESGEPLLLQDKSIEITENGTQLITADEGYDGLNNVSVTTNVEGSGAGKYAPRRISFYNYDGAELNEELINLDISNMTSMNNLFYYCESLTTVDLSIFNTSNMTGMKFMFYNCKKLTEINIKGLNTSNVTDMKSMFGNCYSLTELDLSSFDTSNVTSIDGMFAGCSALTKIDMRNAEFTKLPNASNTLMFNNVPADCLVIVKDDTAKNWVMGQGPSLTNVKTVAELEAS